MHTLGPTDVVLVIVDSDTGALPGRVPVVSPLSGSPKSMNPSTSKF